MVLKKYAEIHMEVDYDNMRKLLKDTYPQNRTNVEVMSDALALYNWAINETKEGRKIFSGEEDGKKPRMLILRSLEHILLELKANKQNKNFK